MRPFLGARFMIVPELSRLLLFPPLHTSPPSINLPAGKKSYLTVVYIDPQISTKNEIAAKNMKIGIDHGYYAIKTRNCSFPADITPCGSHEPTPTSSLVGGDFLVQPSSRLFCRRCIWCSPVRGLLSEIDAHCVIPLFSGALSHIIFPSLSTSPKFCYTKDIIMPFHHFGKVLWPRRRVSCEFL